MGGRGASVEIVVDDDGCLAPEIAVVVDDELLPECVTMAVTVTAVSAAMTATTITVRPVIGCFVGCTSGIPLMLGDWVHDGMCVPVYRA